MAQQSPESRFDRIRHIGLQEAQTLGSEFVKACELRVYMSAHLGTDETVRGRLLPAFAVVRDIMRRNESREHVGLDDLNGALGRGRHLVGEVHTWPDQRDTLVRAYLVDREAIDSALDAQKSSEDK